MALNTETGIDPAVDRFVIKSLSSGNVLNFSAVWPRVDGGALQGANPDLQYFKRVASDPPDIDHRYELQSADVFTLTTPAPAEGLPVGTFGTIYTPVKLPLNTLLAQIESAFNQQVQQQLPNVGNIATGNQAVKALAKKQAGSILTADEETLLAGVVSSGGKIDLLEARMRELMNAAEADEDYDLTVWPVLS